MKLGTDLANKTIKIRLAAAVIAALISGAAIVYLAVPAVRKAAAPRDGGKGKVKAAPAVTYLCPMHPFVTTSRPSACPICGMNLVLKEGATSEKKSADSGQTPPGVTLSSQQQILANVATAEVSQREFSTETLAAGRVSWDERRLTRVSSRLQGRVERLHVNFTGSRISAGAPLLDIYSPDLVSAQREYLLAQDGAEQAKDSPFAESRAMMEGLRDAARSRMKVWGVSDRQIAELERSRQPKKVVPINAPVAGVVTERLVTAGQYVNEGTPLFSVGSLSSVWVFAELYENDLVRIELGTPSQVTTEAFPGKIFHGRVSFVDPVVNPETRTLKVRVDLDNRAGLLKPEMFVKVRLKGRRIKKLAVPEGAVIFSGERSMVWVASGRGSFLPRYVTLGLRGDGFYEVISGLSGGESVAASGGFLIDGESRLNALNAGASGQERPQ